MIGGWLLDYMSSFASGRFKSAAETGLDTDTVFQQMLEDPVCVLSWTFIILFITALVCCLGFNQGVEKITKVTMAFLLLILLVLGVRSVGLPGAMAGVRFYLVPNIENFIKSGPLNVIADAMMQAFFTLILGVGAMAIFGSRIGQDHTLFGEFLHIGGPRYLGYLSFKPYYIPSRSRL